MAYDKFLIAPFDENSGLTTNMRPWQIPDNAWAVMENAYVFRGRIKKRFGSKYMGAQNNPLLSRLRLNLATTDGSGNLAFTVLPGTILNPGSQFSAGSVLFTVTTVPSIVGNAATLSTDSVAIGTVRLDSTAPNVYKFRITGGQAAIANTIVYWYPGLPVMGLDQFEFAAVNNFPTLGYDTQFAYTFTSGSWGLTSGSPTWHGSDTNFFWSYNWVGPNAAATALTRALFVTNFYVTNINGAGTANDDPIYYWNGTTWTQYSGYAATNTAKTAFLNPNGGAAGTGPFLQTALIVVPFHGRLVALNTIENDGTGNGTATFGANINYVNRARWTSEGSPFAVNAWYPVGASDSTPSYGITGGWQDASTLEAIISAEFIKDRLIVYFEESTWELVFTGNPQEVFLWQKLNTELGSMATFSTIAFDRAVLTVGEVGIHSCNGSNVSRIDQKIPDEIFDISNPSSESQRICGIRDYYNELVYWSVPEESQLSVQPYPMRVLVYNYQNKTWAYADDCITTFGYWDGQPQLTWATLGGTWEEWTTPWNAGDAAKQVRQVIAGNQQGYTFIIQGNSEEATRNAGVLSIVSMSLVAPGIEMVIYNHSLQSGDYILVEYARGDIDFTLPGNNVNIPGSNIYIVQYVDQNTIIAFYPESVVEQPGGVAATFTGNYLGGGTAARVSNYNLYSKQWNPYDKDGRNVYIAKIDFGVIRTPTGQVTVDYSSSSTDLSSLTEGLAQNSIMGTGVLETSPYDPALYPLEQFQNRLWHPVYLQIDGECIQINIYMSEVQMCNPEISLKDFQIEGIILHTKAVSYRLQ